MLSSISERFSVRGLGLGWALAFLLGVVPGSPRAEMPGTLAIERFEVGPNVYVRALALDQARGSIWVGTSAGALEIGLDTLEARQVFTRKEGLANEYVFAIGVAPGGGVWLGTNGVGASRWQGGDGMTCAALADQNLLDGLRCDRLDIGPVILIGVRHDGSRVRGDQDTAVPLAAQRLARLRAGIVKLAALPDDDRSRADDENGLYVSTLRHARSLRVGARLTSAVGLHPAGLTHSTPPDLRRAPA